MPNPVANLFPAEQKTKNPLVGLLDALREKAPEVYGSLGGLLGTAPDQFEGSVLDPLTARVRSGAEYGFPVGTALNIAPLAGAVMNRASALKAAAPAMKKGQAGAIVWHGSPHKFDKFDASKIGTGEGAQAYGHGLYLAESPDVARTYAAETAFKHGQKDIAEMLYSQKLGDASAAAKALRKEMESMRWERYAPGYRQQYDDALAKLDAWTKAPPQTGQVYKVDLPDEAIAKMLDWDKPLSEQAPEVQKALNNLPADVKAHLGIGKYDDLKGGIDIVKPLGGLIGDAKVPAILRQQGIPGIRYLDGGSRGAGAGTSNYVVFPGNESLLTILERNGIRP